MLRLIIGKAGTGKTAGIINEIKEAVDKKLGERIFIVPEQYSHEAEKELASVCGDTMSLYAEVFSFTGFARRISACVGGGAVKYLDKGGRVLCMALALQGISSRLKVYSAAQNKAELQSSLLAAVDELKSAGITSDMLSDASASLRDALGDKLDDMALIMEAYSSIASGDLADPSDRLDVLAEQLSVSPIDENTHIYVDGFIDFTAQERKVLRAIMAKGAQLTVCLTVDSLEGDSEIYALSRISARRLIADCAAEGQKYTVTAVNSEESRSQLTLFADNMFSYSARSFEDQGMIKLYRADSMLSECELAASEVIRLVRDEHCRWRDIAVAVRGFDSYRGALVGVFEHYGIPLFITKKSELMSRALPAFISLAYEIVDGYWDIDDTVSFMRTGLAGLDESECDELENYIFKWQIRGDGWKRKGDWHQHPDGYGAEFDSETAQRLEHINSLRYRISLPLERFERRGKECRTAREHCENLSSFFEDIKLPQQLNARSQSLIDAGYIQTAREYVQLWDLTVSALEQCHSIMGDTAMDMSSFGKLLVTMLSKYDVGTIPVALDRVSAGDFDRMRRRHIKHLIVLGASDDRLPSPDSRGGIFSEDERRRLLEADIDIGGSGDGELWREFALIYNCLTLPSESLTMCYSTSDIDGEARRESFVCRRAMALFSLEKKTVDEEKVLMCAAAPAMSLASRSLTHPTPVSLAAREYFLRTDAEHLRAVEGASQLRRGTLSAQAVHGLYGVRPRFSASQADKFVSCKFSYFCQYGLRAKPYEPAFFRPPEIGTFMHEILENTAREARKRGGFASLTDGDIRSLVKGFVNDYVSRELNDYREKSPRFIYLFKRLTGDVEQITLDMARELRSSSFEPLDFELNFGDKTKTKPIELGEGESSLTLTGIADRVDGYLHEGRLYLRVVDYKTGRKSFSMSDVWYGMGLQMLLYLFALEKNGEEMYGKEIVPAGVMYVPARNVLLSAAKDMSSEDIDKKRSEELRRSGIVLFDDEIIEAWEHGDEKKYIPIKLKRGKLSQDGLVSYERMGVLSRHITKSLTQMAQQLHRGSIAADPYYRTQQETACARCDYFRICHFEDGVNGEECRFMPKLNDADVWELLEGDDSNE